MTQIRSSILAGEWYPHDPDDLKEMIQGYLDRVPERRLSGKPVGLISPHAGYVYSGFSAAHGYKQLIGKSYEVVVILSPFHSYPRGKYMIHSASAYETPIGRVPVARDLVEKLNNELEIVDIAQEGEHSIEIQLPFLQMTLRKFSLLPIMVWNPNVHDVADMVGALEKILKGRDAFLIASTDMHHLNSYADVKLRDVKVVETLRTLQLDKIRNILTPESCTVCGKVPVSIVVDLAKRFGATGFEDLYHSNSKDEYKGAYSGSYVVGYLSAVLTGEKNT